MLYERWRETAGRFGDDLAVLLHGSGERVTFRQLDTLARAVELPQGEVVLVRERGVGFIAHLIACWARGRVACPVEPGQAPPDFPPPPAGMGVAHIKLTSATTGSARGVLFTGPQLEADVRNITATMGLRREWPNVGLISLAHSYGFSNLVLPLLLEGIPLVLGEAPLPEVLRSMARAGQPLTAPAVPALWRMWHDAKAIPKNIRLAISAGAPLPLALEQAIFERFALKVHNFYGATECGGIAYDAGDCVREDGAAVGSALRNVELSLGANEALVVGGPAVGLGYWPQGDGRLGEGRYESADLAALDGGRVTLRGRLGDVMNVAGRKVMPEAIESVLGSHPGVEAVVVFAVPSEVEGRGDVIVACVEPSGGVDAAGLRAYAQERLEPWQVPRDWWLVPEIRANARGKLSRAEWRRRFLARAPRGAS